MRTMAPGGRAVHAGCVLDRVRFALLFASVPATAVVASWLIGDISAEGVPPADRIYDPLPLSKSAEQALGVSAAVVVALGGAAAVSAVLRGGRAQRAAATVMPLVGLAVYLAFGYRVMTAAISGANIGAGLFQMTAFVVVPFLIWLSVVIWRNSDSEPDAPDVDLPQ
jgi:hypothetical protein